MFVENLSHTYIKYRYNTINLFLGTASTDHLMKNGLRGFLFTAATTVGDKIPTTFTADRPVVPPSNTCSELKASPDPPFGPCPWGLAPIIELQLSLACSLIVRPS